ncbi:hypothetical protein QYF61_017929 [Mycteria americana]|uniref:Uncharacterized protein n=1 Tax=Mycteria americana TaxID=33587 RepID=A0AAN7SD62_MYCAM|nr:hypothetical protein QYF61_017929 [Mycteria americana]
MPPVAGLFSPHHVVVHWVIPSQLQDFPFPFVELPEVPVSPFLQPVKVPLNGSTTIWHISHSFQSCIICKLVEGAPCPIILIINEDVEQY